MSSSAERSKLLEELGITENTPPEEARARIEAIKKLTEIKKKSKFQTAMDYLMAPAFGDNTEYWRAIAERDRANGIGQIPDIHYHDHKHLHVDTKEEEAYKEAVRRLKLIADGRSK